MKSKDPSKDDVAFTRVTTGVATAVATSTIMHTGKGVIASLARHPVVLFGLGIAAGYFTHKYRKEIMLITCKTAEQSKHFILRQNENLQDLFEEFPEEAGDRDIAKKTCVLENC
ncbi:MAG: hypothetical protein WCS87_02740 [Methylococcaceae bacterium]